MSSVGALLTFILMFVQASDALVLSVRFVSSQLCNLQDRVNAGCSKPQRENVGSLLQCANLCRGDCLGFSMLQNGTCVLHSTCAMSIATAPCANGTTISYPAMVTSASPCLNKGVWNVAAMVCQCNNSWVGLRCERYPTSCAELVKYGYPVGVYAEHTLQLKRDPFKVRCNLVSAAVQNTVVMYNTGKSDNNRTWKNYEEGFYLDTQNFWVGLKNFKAMNELGLRTLALDTTIQTTATGVENYGFRYRNVDVSDDNGRQYTIRFNTAIKVNTNATYADCLTPVNGSEFSTWDKDNDGDDSASCASAFGAGWWFKTCGDNSTCSPMGAKGQWKMAGLDLNTTRYVAITFYYQNN